MLQPTETAVRASSQSFSLDRLSFADAVTLGQALRGYCAVAETQQDTAGHIVDHLYDTLRDPDTGFRSCALIRCFQTHPYASLPPREQTLARSFVAPSVSAEFLANLRCLTLLATRGEETAWNRPEDSAGHHVIPLPDVAMIERAPMIARLLADMGIEARHVVAPASEFTLDAATQQSFNVFHVETALGSEYIPAQQTFVEQYGIRSVVGMGGLLTSGELFAMILFSRVHVSREVAALFRTLALSVKLAFLPFAPQHIFSKPDS